MHCLDLDNIRYLNLFDIKFWTRWHSQFFLTFLYLLYLIIASLIKWMNIEWNKSYKKEAKIACVIWSRCWNWLTRWKMDLECPVNVHFEVNDVLDCKPRGFRFSCSALNEIFFLNAATIKSKWPYMQMIIRSIEVVEATCQLCNERYIFIIPLIWFNSRLFQSHFFISFS